MKMAKTKRATRAEPTTARPTMAGLQDQIEEIHERVDILRSKTAPIDELARLASRAEFNTQLELQAGVNDEVKNKLTQLETQLAQSIEVQNNVSGIHESDIGQIKNKLDLLTKLESELVQSANDIEYIGHDLDEAEKEIAVLKSINKPSLWSWAPVGIIALAISIFLGVQRGCNHGSPTPAPDENEQSIIEPAKAKKLVGTVIFVHDRDPMSPADVALLQACEDLADSREDFEFKSYDSVDDKSAKVANYKSKAKDKGIDPPFMLNIVGDKASFAPMAKDFAGVVKVFGK